MTFKQFLKTSLECTPEYIMEVSKFKREDPERYEKYRDRLTAVEGFYRENQSRDTSTFRQPLTEEKFYKVEKEYNSLCKLRGKEPTNTDME